MIDISIFKNLKGTKLKIADTDWIDGNETKRIRTEDFHMSQNAFSEAIGMSKKIVEIWEEENRKPSGSVQKLMYLLDKHPELMNELYCYVDELNRHEEFTDCYRFKSVFESEATMTEKQNTWTYANATMATEEVKYG